MTVVGDLVAAIAADPNDDAPQLVIADLLQAEGDPRGVLIALDRAERAGQLDDPDALHQLLVLAAEYSFPLAANMEEPRLELVVEGNAHVAKHAGKTYAVLDDDELVVEVYDANGELLDTHSWDVYMTFEEAEQTTVLTLISDAIRAGSPLDELVLPYSSLPLPIYDGGPVRGYRLPIDFLARYGILRNRYGLAARDYHRWHAIWARLKQLTAAR